MTQAKIFTISSAIKFGWETYKKRFIFFTGICLAFWGVEFLLSKISDSLQEESKPIWLLVILVSWFVEWGLSLGLYSILLKSIDGHKAKFAELFSKFKLMLMLNYFVASLLSGLAILGGLILLVIPGLIIAVRLGFYYFIILEKEIGPIDAIKASWNMTKGHTVQLLLLSLALIGLNILGLLAFVVGLLVTVPVSMLVSAHVYRQLVKK